MIHISEFGRIKSDFYCIGPPDVPVFLLDGKSPVIFEAGASSLFPYYREKLQGILGSRTPSYLFLTHAHFDHCGSAGLLKKLYPDMAVCGSAAGAEIIKKPSALKLIAALNGDGGEDGSAFIPFEIERVLHDGELITAGDGLKIEIIATPGHTRDMLSYYIHGHRILIPSESVGVPTRNGYIFSEFLVDYDLYVDSLKRLAGYEVDYLMLAHGAYLTGDECRRYFSSAMAHTERFRDKIEGLLADYGDDIDAVMGAVKKEEYDPVDGGKQPEEAYLLNLRAKVNAIKKRSSILN